MEIECSFGTSNQVYVCNVAAASIITPNENIISFKGNHHPGRNNNDVTWISFSDLEVEYFPRDLQRIFPNLNALAIVNCGLNEISQQDLTGLEKLVYLGLRYTRIKSLPDDLFNNMPNLKKIDLSHNKIEFASSRLIEPIENQLDFFYLSSNTSINEFYHRGGNDGCETVQELMAKIDEQCKPPEPQVVSIAP